MSKRTSDSMLRQICKALIDDHFAKNRQAPTGLSRVSVSIERNNGKRTVVFRGLLAGKRYGFVVHNRDGGKEIARSFMFCLNVAIRVEGGNEIGCSIKAANEQFVLAGLLPPDGKKNRRWPLEGK